MKYISSLSVLLGAVLFGGFSTDVSGQQAPIPVVTPTFSQQVAPIVYAKCIQCHRPGEVAPMSLINYRDVQPWATSIRKQLVERTMPPFHSPQPVRSANEHAAADRTGNRDDRAMGGRGRAGRRPRAAAGAANPGGAPKKRTATDAITRQSKA